MALTDQELTGTQIQLMIKHKAPSLKTAADYKKYILRSLFNMMVAARYQELVRQPDPPFVNTNAGITVFMAGLDMYSMDIILKPGKAESGFKTAFRETERIKQFGFTATELERAKKNYMRSMESALKEKDKTPSINYVSEYQQYFLRGDAAPGIEREYAMAKKFTETITLKEVNDIGKEYIKDTNRDVLIVAPDKEKNNLPDELAVNQWIKEIKMETLLAYSDNINDDPLLKETLNSGKIRGEKLNASLGTTELTLTNGIKVTLKKTDFKNDEILFSAFSPGGTSLYPDHEYQSAANAGGIISSFGVGSFDATQLSKKLSGKKYGWLLTLPKEQKGFQVIHLLKI